ncbi:MAG: hypothetical protein E7318_03215 [Clostridiales bacterium]|nr:hypothetical protein [Clostridiales bacterium]
MKMLEDYRDDLLSGKYRLVLNPLNSKYSMYNDDDPITYELTFNAYRRISEDQTVYQAMHCYYQLETNYTTYHSSLTKVGELFYLVLEPQENNMWKVLAAYPKAVIPLPADLENVLRRDEALTGTARNPWQDLRETDERIEQEKLSQMTPEEQAKYQKDKHEEWLWGNFTNPAVTTMSILSVTAAIVLFVLAIVQEEVVYAGWSFLAFASVLLILPLMILFKKPIIRLLVKREERQKNKF